MLVYVVKGNSASVQNHSLGLNANEKYYFTALQKFLPLATFEQSTAHQLVNGLINYWLRYFCYFYFVAKTVAACQVPVFKSAKYLAFCVGNSNTSKDI